MIKKSINTYSVTVDELKEQLKIELEYKEADNTLKDYLIKATHHITNLIGSDIELTTNKCMSKDIDNLRGIFYTSPFVSITSLKIDGKSINVTDLSIIEYYSHFIIEDIQASKSIEIEFITGYETIPPELKQAILIYASDLHDTLINETTIGVSVSTTNAVNNLTASHKRKYW
ncbi:MAG: hypothetical protein N4A40_09820 [Tissierellales bacterium]|jgi:hypothetical protein|nr:hypothetical protein [Tissierellales bacterium]